MLQATEVLAKHDENYVPPELGDQLKKAHQPMGISEKDLKGESERDRNEKTMKEGNQ